MSKRLAGGLVLVALIVALATIQPFPQREALRAFLDPLGVWALPLWTLLYAAGVVAVLPGIALTALSVWLFGFAGGCAASIGGATLGACGSFLAARTLGREWIAARLADRRSLRRLDRQVAAHGAAIVLLLRLLPLLPFNLLNYLCGLTGITLSAYALTTLVGILPGAVVYSFAAQQMLDGAAAGSPWREPRFVLAMGLLALLLVALPLAFQLADRRAGGKLLERLAARMSTFRKKG